MPSAEKISAVYHSNGTDVWVMTHRLDSDEFLAYLVTKNGVIENPVVNRIGLFYSNNNSSNTADGSKLYVTRNDSQRLSQFDLAAGTEENLRLTRRLSDLE